MGRRRDNPLALSIDAAERANDELARITARLGTKANPRGRVLAAYRAALRLIRAALEAQTDGGRVDVGAIQDALDTLEATVEAATTAALRDGWDVGQRLATTQIAAYDLDLDGTVTDEEYLTGARDAVQATVRQQRQQVNALLLGGAALALIVGDSTRQGVLRPAPVVREASNWASRAATQAVAEAVAGVPPVRDVPAGQLPGTPQPPRQVSRFQRQAIAALDERTTDCCLRVHGQIVPMDAPFALTGTPRYADQMMEPPFHDWCRTVTVLYQAAWDDGITEQMRDGADTILAERAEGGTGERNPANAFA